jgi:hypothetical protein
MHLMIMTTQQLGPVMVPHPGGGNAYTCKLTGGVMLEGMASRMFRYALHSLPHVTSLERTMH